MSEKTSLAEFLAPYIERVYLGNIIGAVVENRLKQGVTLRIGHSKDIEIIGHSNTFESSNFEDVHTLDEVSFGYLWHFTHGEGALSSPYYDTLLVLEDDGYDDRVLAHYKLKDNDLENLVGYFRV